MSLNPFISRILKAVINNIEPLLKGIIIVTLIYFYFFFVVLFTTKPDPVLDYLKALNLKTLLLILLTLSILITLIKYYLDTRSLLRANRIDKILPYMKQFDKYFPLAPLSMISIGFLLMTFVIFNKIFLQIGMILSGLGFILFYVMILIKAYYENKIHYTLQKASEILDEIDLNKKKGTNVKKFSKYFIKFLNNIDSKLNKGIKINNLIKDDKNPIPIKNTLTNYLPIFIKFGKQEQILSLKNRINVMLTLVNQHDEFDLNITSVVLDIYKDIKDFLYLNKYPISEQRWRVNLSVLKDKDLLYVIFGIVQTVVFIVYLLVSGKANL